MPTTITIELNGVVLWTKEDHANLRPEDFLIKFENDDVKIDIVLPSLELHNGTSN